MNELKRIVKESTLDVIDSAVYEWQMINRYIFCFYNRRIDLSSCVSHEEESK